VVVKGLVLSGGKGTRLRPFTYTGAKQLVPLANKPVLFYALEDLVAAGITEIGLVVGDTADQIKAAVGDGSSFGCRVTYIPQERPGGLAHAVRTAAPYLGNEPFVMYLGDNFIQGGIRRFVDAFTASGAAAHILLHTVPNPESFGVAVVEGREVVRMVEKPTNPMSNLALVGIYLFGPEIHHATREITLSLRGELEITDAIQALLDSGHQVVPHVLDSWWIDTGKMEDMLDANRVVLHDLVARIEGAVSEDCIIQGNVVVEAGAVVERSKLRGPLIIGANTRISNAHVGPFTAIGPDCEIVESEIEHSIVMEHTRILNVPHRIEDSLIGRNVVVFQAHGRPRAYKLMLGDHSQAGVV
jgi:glucose-1-phosphate thymidylyltransferase